MLTKSERTYYTQEIEGMAARQANLASQLAAPSLPVQLSDIEVAQQLGHQARKAARLSTELAQILGVGTSTSTITTAKP